MTEITAAIRYIIGALAAQEIVAYEGIVPDTLSTEPYITVQFQSERPDDAVGIEYGGTEILLLVKCWVLSRTLADVETLAGVVHSILITNTAQVFGGKFNVLGCFKESNLRDSEAEGDAMWQCLGGVYAVQMHRI